MFGPKIIGRDRRPWRRRGRENPHACRSNCCAAPMECRRAPTHRQRFARSANAHRSVARKDQDLLRQHALDARDMRGLAAMRSASQRQFFVAEAVTVGRAALDQRQSLQRLDRRARKHRRGNVADCEHRRPSASATATAPRWRLSTSGPRVTSTRTGLPILIFFAIRMKLPLRAGLPI